MPASLDQQLIELIQQSRSFSLSEKKEMIERLPYLQPEQIQRLTNILIQEQRSREKNRNVYTKRIQEINEKYTSNINAEEEMQKMDNHLAQKLECASVIRNVQMKESRTKENDIREAENLLTNS